MRMTSSEGSSGEAIVLILDALSPVLGYGYVPHDARATKVICLFSPDTYGGSLSEYAKKKDGIIMVKSLLLRFCYSRFFELSSQVLRR